MRDRENHRLFGEMVRMEEGNPRGGKSSSVQGISSEAQNDGCTLQLGAHPQDLGVLAPRGPHSPPTIPVIL